MHTRETDIILRLQDGYRGGQERSRQGKDGGLADSPKVDVSKEPEFIARNKAPAAVLRT